MNFSNITLDGIQNGVLPLTVSNLNKCQLVCQHNFNTGMRFGTIIGLLIASIILMIYYKVNIKKENKKHPLKGRSPW